jgi:peroxiredoxin 6
VLQNGLVPFSGVSFFFLAIQQLNALLTNFPLLSSTAIRLGNIVPDFAADTTQGPFESFHEWKKGKWAILFSHPADFTPVCTTEIGRLALKYDELTALDCKLATLSVDPVKSHNEWLVDVVAHCEN